MLQIIIVKMNGDKCSFQNFAILPNFSSLKNTLLSITHSYIQHDIFWRSDHLYYRVITIGFQQNRFIKPTVRKSTEFSNRVPDFIIFLIIALNCSILPSLHPKPPTEAPILTDWNTLHLAMTNPDSPFQTDYYSKVWCIQPNDTAIRKIKFQLGPSGVSMNKSTIFRRWGTLNK